MATVKTAQWGNSYSPYLQVVVNTKSSTNNDVTLSYTISYRTTSLGGAAYTNGKSRSYTVNIGGQKITGSININGKTTFTVKSGTVKLSKKQSAYNASISISLYMDVTWAGEYAGTVKGSGSIRIPARTYVAHGTPTISASTKTCNYGQSITISWAKSSTQGNANFDRFELLQAGKKIYSGSSVSKSVKPSEATGAKGGNVTYTIKEIHDWYGTEYSKQATVTVNVRSGVVTVYDSSGNKHTGLVTAYDSSGNAHYVLISAYDSSGAKHSVV